MGGYKIEVGLVEFGNSFISISLRIEIEELSDELILSGEFPMFLHHFSLIPVCIEEKKSFQFGALLGHSKSEKC